MNCPKCGFFETYRKSPHSLTVWCDRCGYSFSVSQPQEPILSKEVWKSKALKGTYYITVWRCSADIHRYSFAYCARKLYRRRTAVSFAAGGASLPVQFNQFPECDWLSGSYATPEEALTAGIEEVLA